MPQKLDEMIIKLLEVYTQEELKSLLGVSLKSIDNYKNGANPSKKTQAELISLYNKVSENKWQKLPAEKNPFGSLELATERALIRVMLDELAFLKSKITRVRTNEEFKKWGNI